MLTQHLLALRTCRTAEEAAAGCDSTPGCTAFDTAGRLLSVVPGDMDAWQGYSSSRSLTDNQGRTCTGVLCCMTSCSAAARATLLCCVPATQGTAQDPDGTGHADAPPGHK